MANGVHAIALSGKSKRSPEGHTPYDAARQPTRVELHHPERLTEQRFEYDVRLRPRRTYVLREPTGAAPDLSAVTVPFDQTYGWDAASNLVSVTDERIGEEWDDGQLPQSATIGHDSLYRVASVDYTYTHQSGEAVYQDLATDWRTDRAFHEAADPMAERPAPKIGALPSDRVVNLTYEYDWLANMVEWTDDAHDFYERSIGDIDNGFELGLRPSALYLSTDLPASPPAHSPTTVRGGWLELEYGEGGNVVSMTVHGSCRDVNEVTLCWDDEGADLGSRRAQLRAQCLCASEQHYQYRWDELDRIAEARRYDRAGAGPWDLAVRQRYRYDGANVRTHKETFDDGGEPRTALYAHPGAYERSGVHRDSESSSYTAHPTHNTESQYLVGGARIVCKHPPGDPIFEADFRMTYALTDLLGSTSAVVDLWSGELLEVGTFYPSGAQETLASQQSVAVQPEPMGFTGKEADDEVGVVYFGERYLIPRIGRWASPDPLHVHAVGGGEALNSYHYVSGNLLQALDPFGLEGDTIDVNTAPNCNTAGSGQCAPGSTVTFPNGVTARYNPEAPLSYELAQRLTEERGSEFAASYSRLIENISRANQGGVGDSDAAESGRCSQAVCGRSGVGAGRDNENIAETPLDALHASIPDPLDSGEGTTGGVAGGRDPDSRLGGSTAQAVAAAGSVLLAGRAGAARGALRLGRRASSRHLRHNLQVAGHTPSPGDAAHHIVAGRGRRGAYEAAVESRAILGRHKIDINAPENGIFLPTPAHRRIHTRPYHQEVRRRLRRVAKGSREDVLDALRGIQEDLRAGSFPGLATD